MLAYSEGVRWPEVTLLPRNIYATFHVLLPHLLFLCLASCVIHSYLWLLWQPSGHPTFGNPTRGEHGERD